MGLLRRLHQRILAFARLLLSQHQSPGRVALALFFGCVVGCTPPLGLHFVLCAALSWALRLNLPIMYGAANISIPPMIPLLGWASVEIGTFVTTGHGARLTRSDFGREALPALVKTLFWAWLRGGVLLGCALGGIAATVAYAILRRRHAAMPPGEPASDGDIAIERVLADAAERYRPAHPRYRYYARAKYRMDPCYRALCERIADGVTVVDLGCGLGMLPVALALSGPRRTLVGVDWDAGKIAAGQLAAAGLPSVTLERGDIRAFTLPPCDAITLVDVLHYYEAEAQTALLTRAAAALRPGGSLFIRETDPERRGGARLTRLVERLMVRMGWNRGPQVRYRPLGALRDDLFRLGFSVEQLDLAGATHPGNVLLWAKKR